MGVGVRLLIKQLRLRLSIAWRGRRLGRFGAIWVVVVVLFAISPVVAPGSLGKSALLSMLPFAMILGLASVGQQFVMQQGGLDLSVPGTMSLAAVLVTQIPDGHDSELGAAVLFVLLVGVLIGVFNGVIVTILRVTPLVATLGVNAILYGIVYEYTGGQLAAAATTNLTSFVSARMLSIPVTVWVVAVLLVLITVLMRWTLVGRRFELVGSSPPTARAAGFNVIRYRLSAYVIASFWYTVAGILLAGYVTTPSLTVGDSYLLPTIVAVTLGGTLLGAGTGSAVATVLGALFLQQLDQLVLTLGATSAVQDIVQAVILVFGMGFRSVQWRSSIERLRGKRGDIGGGQRASQVAAGRSTSV